jgi:hypothetical protein
MPPYIPVPLIEPGGLWVAIPLLLLIGLLYLAEKRYPAPQELGPRREGMPASCAWCVYRDGDNCTNPDSSLYSRRCEPGCSVGIECRQQYLWAVKHNRWGVVR